MKPTTPDEIVELSRSLKNKNSSGEDEIPIFIAKFCIEEVKYVLSYIINKSLKYGIYPEGLKTALIKPLLKTGDPTDINNYRPISLLPSFSKIFEHVIVIRVLAFFLMIVVFLLKHSMAIWLEDQLKLLFFNSQRI